MVNIPPLTPHTLLCKSSSAVLMEVKEGPFEQDNAKVIPSWSHNEDYSQFSRDEIIGMLSNLSLGDCFNL